MNTPKTIKILTALLALVLAAGCTQTLTVTPATLPTTTPASTAVLPTLTAAPTEESPEAVVQELLAIKMQAMEERDIEQFLSLINEADHEYFTEQRNWFLIYQDAVISDFSIEVQNVQQIDENVIIATLRQHYYYGLQKDYRNFYYEQKYIRTPDGWRDADLNFEMIETAHFWIKYQPEDAGRAAEVSEEAEKAYANVVQELELEPAGKISIKLYSSQELLRQSTDIRVVYLFSGWSEDGESIKLYARREREDFAPVVAHELTHNITVGVSDSLTSWLAEGLAVYFGNQPLRGGNAMEMNLFTAQELAQPISWLEENNLIRMTDGEKIRLYYEVSAMVVEFMMETYGLEQVKALLNELSTFPRYNQGFDYDEMEIENQNRLHQAIETVFGMDIQAFNTAWLQWIEAKE